MGLEDRGLMLALCRALWPEEGVRWLDTVGVVFAVNPQQGRRARTILAWFPLLGTGANDAKQDFTARFLQALGYALPEISEDRPASLELLRSTL